MTEDFPPNQDRKIFYKGDQIVKVRDGLCLFSHAFSYQVGNRLIRNMSAESFSELFQDEATNGTNVFVKSTDKPEVSVKSHCITCIIL